jgi:hypothetical protein
MWASVQKLALDDGMKQNIILGAIVLAVLVPVLLTLRVTPWLIALVVRDNNERFWVLWRGMRGNLLPLVGALLVIFVPLFAFHFGLTVAAQGAVAGKLSLTLIDGAVSTVQLALLLSLTAVAYFKAKSSPVD